MCTAISYRTKDHYFGRNLDLEFSYNEGITITPRNFPLIFRMVDTQQTHFGIIGTAIISNGFPLYFDATNEAGLSMAALNFPGNAVYLPKNPAKNNVSSFEMIPWILGQCTTVEEAERLLYNTNVVDIAFSDKLTPSPLHWIVADQDNSLTVEPMADGLKIFNNPVGILTNNPPFDYHLHNLSNYLNLTREEPKNHFATKCKITSHSRGLGAFGLPGDLSSVSRFVKAAFTKLNSVYGDSNEESITQFFHILSSVAQQSGCVRVGDYFEKTVYSSCCNTSKGIYYYTTYENRQIVAINMHHIDLDSNELYHYPMIRSQQIYEGN